MKTVEMTTRITNFSASAMTSSRSYRVSFPADATHTARAKTSSLPLAADHGASRRRVLLGCRRRRVRRLGHGQPGHHLGHNYPAVNDAIARTEEWRILLLD